MNKQNKVYQIITDRIIKEMETSKNLNWLKEWTTKGIAKNLITKKNYKGINTILTSIISTQRNYKHRYFLTLKQAEDLGLKSYDCAGKGIPIIFYMIKEIKEYNKVTQKEEIKTTFPIMKYSLVYNISHFVGYEKHIPKEETTTKPFNPIEKAEQIINGFLERENLKVVYGGGSAFYSPLDDFIGLPNKEDFKNEIAFYSTMLHECSHATGHSKRLNRDLKGLQADKKSYSKEEVIAELSASMLKGVCNIDTDDTIKNSSAYIQSWINAMIEDNEFIFKVCSQAQKSADYIQGE